MTKGNLEKLAQPAGYRKYDTTGRTCLAGFPAFLRNTVSSILISAMVAQPVLAQTATISVEPTSGQNTGLDQTASGVTSINIATPNAAGLSHNLYTQFDVGAGGVILNNATQELSASQLGGLMQGNGNLTSGSARVILNEVTSANRSLLEGAVEVHGVAADVILANPNGITCDGCGFINTPRATLTTGSPVLRAGGALSGFEVTGGDVLIGSRGADLRSSGIFDIVSRKISVQGAIGAGGNLNLIAGRNSYDYATGDATSLGADGAEPAIAIDSSLLGGMYAGRITLVSTDAGSGVNMQGQMASNAGQMVLTADGQLVMREARATGRVQARSVTRNVRVERTIFTDDAVVLEGATGVAIADGALVAATGDVSMTGPALTVGNGSVAAAGVTDTGAQTDQGTLTLSGTSITAGNGQLIAGHNVALAATQIDLSRASDDGSDTVRSLGDLSMSSQTVTATNGSVRVGGAAELTGQSDLTLAGGTYQSAGGLLVQAANLTTSAQLGTSGLATLRALTGRLSNTGRIAGDLGLTATASTDLNNAGQMMSARQVELNATGTLTNTATSEIGGGTGVVLTAGAILNDGTTSAEGGALAITSTGGFSNSGTVLSKETATLSVDGAILNSGEISGASTLLVRGVAGGSAGALTNSGTLNAKAATLDVASLSNPGSVSTFGGAMRVTADGAVASSGVIESNTSVTVDADGTITNSGRIESNTSISFAGRTNDASGALNNQAGGVLKSRDTLGIRSASLTNAGSLGSASGEVAVSLDGDLTNTGLIYAGTDATLKADGTVANTSADILAENGLIIEGLTTVRAAALRNISGNIEAIAGDLTINATTVENTRLASVFDATSVVTNTASGNPSITPGEGVTHYYQSIATTTTTENVTHTGAASKLLAGRDIQISADDLTNSYSQIAAAGDVTIAATTVTNTGRDLTRGVVNNITERYITGYCGGSFFGFCYDVDESWAYYNSTTSSTTSIGSVFGTIEAGGALNATATGYLSNNAVRGGATIAGLTSGSRAMDAAAIAATSSARSAVTLANLDVSLAGTLGRGALFSATTDPTMPFLVETRPEFVDAGKFLGSDYFLSRVGNYDPDGTGRRFGDGFVETRLIQDQIFELTGQRQLNGGLDERSQIQALYDNAINVQQDLGLVPGVALSLSQIAALTRNITWLETQLVQGEQVLAPRVYLSNATVQNFDLASGRIIGEQTAIAANSVINSGRIEGRQTLDLNAVLGVENRGGDLFAGEDLTIDAGVLFANVSGTVGAGNDLSISALQLINDTAKNRAETRTGFSEAALQTAALNAGGDLRLDITGDLTSTGGVFTAGETLELRAGGTLDIGSLTLEDRQRGESRDTELSTLRRTNTLASIQAGGDLGLQSGGDTRLTGVAIEAGGNGQITSEGDIEIASVQDEEQFDLSLDVERRGLFGADSSVTQQEASLETQRSTLATGGDLTITSKTGDLTLRSARLQTAGEVDLTATEGTVAFRALEDRDFERDAYRTEDLLWWSEEDKGSDVTSLEEVEILPGGGLRITAGTGILVEYQAKGDLNAALDELTQSSALAWMEDLRNNPDVDWSQIQTTLETWDYESQGLTQAGALLVSAITSFATGGLASGWAETMSSALGVTNASAQVAIEASIKSLTTKSVVALVNNRGDLGAALQEITSDASLRSLITAMVSAGLTDAAIGATDLANTDLSTQTAMQTVSYKLQTGLISASVNAAVSTAINGGDFGEQLFDGWTNAMVMAGLAGVQQRIGDFAQANDIDEGALSKVLAHAVAGGIAAQISGGDFAGGALSGGLSEVLGGAIGKSELDPARQAELQNLIALTVVLITTEGDTKTASLAGNIAGSAHENNYLKHQEAVFRRDAESRLAECKEEASLCSAQNVSDLEREIGFYNDLDLARDALLASACRNPVSAACVQSVRNARAASASYENDPERYTSLGEDWMAAARAGSGAGTAWDPAAFGLGLAAGAALGLNTALGVSAVREAARICGSQPVCTGAMVAQLIGAEVTAEFAGGSVVLTAADGKVLRRIDLDVPPTVSFRNATNTGLTATQRQGILREASQLGQGNLTLTGRATRAEAAELGEAWVGPGYRTASDGRTLVSADGTRTFRPPTAKPNSSFSETGVQINFETRELIDGRWTVRSNAHLDVSD